MKLTDDLRIGKSEGWQKRKLRKYYYENWTFCVGKRGDKSEDLDNLENFADNEDADIWKMAMIDDDED